MIGNSIRFCWFIFFIGNVFIEIAHTPKAKMILWASSKNLQSILDMPHFSTLTPKEQALLLKKIQKALLLPWSQKKIYTCITLYQKLLDNTLWAEKQKWMESKNIMHHETQQSLSVSKQVINWIAWSIKNNKRSFWWALLLIAYIAFAEPIHENVIEKSFISQQLPKQKHWLTGFKNQDTYDQTFTLFEDSINNPATHRALSTKNIASIDQMIDQLDASFDTLLTQTQRLEEKWIYSHNWYQETLSKTDSIQFRNYIATLKDQTRQINKVLSTRTEIDSIDSYSDFLQKSHLITDWIIASVTNDPQAVQKLNEYKHPIAIDRKLWTENSLHTLLHELHHSIAPAHQYHSITEWTTEHCTQLALEQTLWSKVNNPAYKEEVINAVLLQYAFDDPDIKQVNAFTGKQIIPWGKKINAEYIKQLHNMSRDNVRDMYQWIEDQEQKKDMCDAIRFNRLKDYLNTTKYTHPLLVLLLLPQESIDRSDRIMLPKDSDFQQEVPYNKTLTAYWIQTPRSCSSHFRRWLYELVQSHRTISVQWHTFSIEEFQTFDLEWQKWLFHELQKTYIRSPQWLTAWFNLSTTDYSGWSITKQEESLIDYTTEQAYENLKDNLHDLSEKFQVLILSMVFLSMLIFYGSYRQQKRNFKNTNKILQQDHDATVLQSFLPIFWLFPLIIYIQLTYSHNQSINQDLKITTIHSIICLSLIANQLKNIIEQWKALRIANKAITFNITELSDSLGLLWQLQEQQKKIHQWRISTISRLKDKEYTSRKTAFLKDLDEWANYIANKWFTDTIYQNLIITTPSLKKQKTVSAPIIPVQKSRHDVTHREKIHPHSYIPWEQEAIVYTSEHELQNEKVKNNNTLQWKHFVVHFNLDTYTHNERLEEYHHHDDTYFWTLKSIIKVITSFKEIHKKHRAQFTLIAYKNWLPVYTTLLWNTALFIQQLVDNFLTLMESYEWTDLFDTPEVIQVAQTDIRRALPKKREKNIFLWFPQHYSWWNQNELSYQKAAYYWTLFKTLYALPHQSYHNITGIGDYILQDTHSRKNNKRK